MRVPSGASLTKAIPHPDDLAHLEGRLRDSFLEVIHEAGDTAASRFAHFANQETHPAALTAAPGVGPSTAMVAVYPSDEQAAAMRQPNGEDSAILHVTLAFLGELEPDRAEMAAGVARKVASANQALSGSVGGVGAFGDNGAGHPSILMPDVVGLAELRHEVCTALCDAGIHFVGCQCSNTGRDSSRTEHGWTPHMTLGYHDELTVPPKHLLGRPLDFGQLSFAQGDVRRDFDFAAEGDWVLPALGVSEPGYSGFHAMTERDIREWQRDNAARALLGGDLGAVAALTAGAVVAESETGIEIGNVAKAHAEAAAPDYGDTYWNEVEQTVFWISADWTSIDEADAAIADFLAIDEVENVEECAECGPPAGDGWEKVYTSSSVDPPADELPEENALVAAGPPWTQPHPDELVDVDSLVARFRGKSDPIRRAAVEAAAAPALEKAGLSFDATNPFIDDVVGGIGQHVTFIADTTRLNVMRIVRRSYEDGLSIPDTAKAIREGMAAAAGSRATLIARTEMTSLVNGGGLAAMNVVTDAGVGTYLKRWLTAPGASYPRHEDYDGLDGQTVALNGVFDVGGVSLAYPGDPDGPPDEVCNCFPAETPVAFAQLRAATRRWYEGDLVRVRTAAGDELSVTPNHPVLGRDGWVAAGDLREGDDLVRARILGDPVGGPDDDRPVAAIGEIYDLAHETGIAERKVVSPGEFHGDVLADADVDVVSINGSLLVRVEPASDEEVAEIGLAVSEFARSACGSRQGALTGWGHVDDRAFPASRRVRGLHELASIVGAHPLEPKSVRGAAVSDREAESAQSTDDRGPADAELSSDGEHGVSALVSLTQVIEVDRYAFAGYVYNLDAGDGWFTAASLAVANCRCTLIYVESGEAGGGDVEALAGPEEPDDFAVAAPPADDTISVGTSDFVPAMVVRKIKELGLDHRLEDMTPTSKIGRETYAHGKDTAALYKPTGEWTPERAALHDKIVAAYFDGKVASGERTVYFTAGGGASGKSAAIFDVAGKDVGLKELGSRADTIWIDPDRIKAMLPEYNQLRDAGDFYAANGVHEESSELAKRIQAEAQRRGFSVILDTTGSSSTFVQKLEAAKAAGYDVKVTMFSIPTNEAIVRSMARAEKKGGASEGRYVSIQALKNAHAGASRQMAIWKDSPAVSEWRVYDNTGKEPTLVAEGGASKAKVIDPNVFNSILAKAEERPGSAATVAPTAPARGPSVVTLVPGPAPSVRDAVDSYQQYGVERYAAAYRLNETDARARINEAIANAVKDSEVRLRVTPDVLTKVIADGRFKSQFESGTSHGLLDHEYRADAEQKMFGYPTTLAAAERPIYGYLSGSALEGDGQLSRMYGKTIVRFNDEVRDRATFTLSDSLGAGRDEEITPQPLTSPNLRALFMQKFGTDLPIPAIDPTLERMSTGYAEAQIHGGLRVGDIREIVFEKGDISSEAGKIQASIDGTEAFVKDTQMRYDEWVDEGRAPDSLEFTRRQIDDANARLEEMRQTLELMKNDGAEIRRRLTAAGIPYRIVDSLDSV